MNSHLSDGGMQEADSTEPQNDEVTVLEVSGLAKSFGELQAVDRASFEVKAGEITSLVGPNGAGKTTVFNLIAGSLRADGGIIRFKGHNLLGAPAYERPRLGIGRTFQDSRLILELPAWENVAVGFQSQPGETLRSLFFRPVSALRYRREAREKAEAILGTYGLGALADVEAANLSYGDRKLVGLAQAEATGAELLLLDEPTSGLDRATLERMMKRLNTLVEGGRTVLIVEHNMQLVREFSKQMVFLHNGTVVTSGTPEELMARGDLRDIYFGVAA